MLSTLNKAALAGLTVMLVGCGPARPLDEWDDQQLAERVEQLSQHHDTAAASVPLLGRSDTSPPENAAESWYVARALATSPDIRASRQRVERLRERVPQATALPDPMATITFGELAETAAGQVDYIVGVRQSLPFPGTLDGRGEVARQQVVEALYELEAKINEIAGQVRRAYWAHQRATLETAVLSENRDLLDQLDAAVQARVRVGRADQGDYLRVSRARSALDNQLDLTEQRRQSAAALLSRLTGQAPERASNALEVDWDFQIYDAASLRQRAQAEHPQVSAALARVGTSRKRLSQARRERRPDLVLGVQYGAVGSDGLAPSANGDDQVAATVGVSLPIWADRDDAAEREALRGIGEAVAAARAEQDQALFAVDDALARLESNQQVLRRLREQMMPEAQQAIELGLAGYRTGESDFLQLLEDWQTLLDDRLQEARVIAALHQAAADLDQATGRAGGEQAR